MTTDIPTTSLFRSFCRMRLRENLCRSTVQHGESNSSPHTLATKYRSPCDEVAHFPICTTKHIRSLSHRWPRKHCSQRHSLWPFEGTAYSWKSRDCRNCTKHTRYNTGSACVC